MNETNVKVAAAIKEIDSLCKGKQWRMSIPVQDTDSDVVISTAIMELTNDLHNAKNMIYMTHVEFFELLCIQFGLDPANADEYDILSGISALKQNPA